jgi:hypothetical protein
MRELILRDDRELGRIETAIANIERASGGNLRTHCLLEALKAERNELLKIGCRSGVSGRRRTPAGQRRFAS